MAWYEGPCRITVIGVDAAWPQRAVVAVSGAGGARIVIPGTVGAARYIEARSWHLELEHQYEGTWRPNIRAVKSRWETSDGIRTQTIHSKDVDWARNQHERNLVLRLEWAEEPTERHVAGRDLDAPARSATESSSGGLAHRPSAGPTRSRTSSSSAGPSFTAPPAASPARGTSHGPTTGSSPW
ncbi:hypothetical protein [Streptomyces sp. NPDC051183]|uniref:hypothetical protein n=1 Tax=unclassified Streptomyces TaxID=2593676 RepID=UPI003434F9F0